MKNKLVLFDFDGVFINTLPVCFEIGSEVNSGLTLDEYRSFFEGSVFNAKRYDGSLKIYHPDLNILYEKKTRTLEIPKLLEGLARDLESKHVLTIVSSADTSVIRKILKKASMENIFSDILGSDVHSSKVVKIKSLLKKYGIEPRDAVMITDTLGDIREANECGVKSIGVLWGWHEEETLLKGSPAALTTTVPELEVAIRKILSE